MSTLASKLANFCLLEEFKMTVRVQNDCCAQVFGELHLYQGKTVVNVHLASDARGLDCAAYYRALCRIQSHLPCNVHRR